MTRFGYTLMTEQSGPRELVGYAQAAEAAGFDFVVSSDHYFPWLDEMGHSPNAWVLLGAVAQATESVELMTYVTCPTFRYPPALVAQQAATLAVLSGGRFQLNLGSGENLNEHVVGQGWPRVAVRHDRLEEAVKIIRQLFTGEQVTWSGRYFRIDEARLWDLPDRPVEIGIAVSQLESVKRFAPLADHYVSVEPSKEPVRLWERIRERVQLPASRKIGQVPICWSPSLDSGVRRAHELFRWFGGGWPVNSELATPAAFAAASQFVRPDDVAGSMKIGPDLDELATAVQPYLDAGFTDVAIVQAGDESQTAFLREIAPQLLTRLRRLRPAATVDLTRTTESQPIPS